MPVDSIYCGTYFDTVNVLLCLRTLPGTSQQKSSSRHSLELKRQDPPPLLDFDVAERAKMAPRLDDMKILQDTSISIFRESSEETVLLV